LENKLRQLDNQNYARYKELLGCWETESGDDGLMLYVDRVQSDAFAGPSRVRLRFPHTFPQDLYASRIRRVALCDYLNRQVHAFLNEKRYDARQGGSGFHSTKGGEIRIVRPCQQVLETAAVVVTPDWMELRLQLGLPGHGRKIAGRLAQDALIHHVPAIAGFAGAAGNFSEAQVRGHVDSVEDQQALRGMLRGAGLCAFVLDGALLPRCAGDSDCPMARDSAVLFESPLELRVSFELPHRGTLTGMGIARGVTLIVGGGFHGKSTLLRALEMGVYDHIPGDGREFCVTEPSAVKVRAEDGREITGVNISPFIDNLPFGKPTDAFSTSDASGSTSQAASIMEALEAGSQCLLVDEDTSATNFMIRDRRMQMLVQKKDEPITPFIYRIRALAQQGVSCILVIGGSGDYFSVADWVIQMNAYKPHEVTQRAHEIVAQSKAFLPEDEGAGGEAVVYTPRVPLASFHPKFKGKIKIKTPQRSLILYGEHEVVLSAVEQIPDKEVTHTIASCLMHICNHLAGHDKTLQSILSELDAAIDQHSLDVLSRGYPDGNFKRPRMVDVAAALNRVRPLKVVQVQQENAQ